MPDIVLFGATGYTGRLTARELADRGASFALAGRDPAKLEGLGRTVGRPPTFVAESGDIPSLVRALEDAKVLITCVGPFVEQGRTAVEAALQAGVHYIDSTGEGPFVGWLLAEKDAAARSAEIAMAPAMGFDEVPADVVATLAAEGMKAPQLRLTYAVPRSGSTGTRRSAVGVMTSQGPWIRDGRVHTIGMNDEERWAPMPSPLGPRRAVSFPFAICHLAPRHLEPRTFETYVTTGEKERLLMKVGLPVLRAIMNTGARSVAQLAMGGNAGAGPDDEARARGRWTILAEASNETGWRNVAATGTDVYGLTARLLARGACEMASDGYDRTGILSPVQAFGLGLLTEELTEQGARLETYAPV